MVVLDLMGFGGWHGGGVVVATVVVMAGGMVGCNGC